MVMVYIRACFYDTFLKLLQGYNYTELYSFVTVSVLDYKQISNLFYCMLSFSFSFSSLPKALLHTNICISS